MKRAVAVRFVILVVVSILIMPLAASAATMVVSTHTINASGTVGGSVPSQTVTISRSGSGAMKWNVSAASQGWISVSPKSGVNGGSATVSFVNLPGAAGTYSGTFLISSGSQVETITVNLSLTASSGPPPPPPGDWTFCGYEGAFCSFSGTLQVRYGANGVYNYQTLTGGTACTNAVFGDPAFGATKHCDYGAAAQAPPPPTVNGLSISGPSSVTVSQTAQYTARATYTDGSSQNLTTAPTWSTSNGSLASISSGGVMSALSAGTVNVQASYSGVTATPFSVSLVASTSPPSPGGIYVSTTGSDSNSGTSSSPVQTIHRGVELANQLNATGQTSHVYIAAGVYRDAVVLDPPQATDAAMIIEGAPGTVLSGADLWQTGWTATGNNAYTHAWPYRWGAKGIPAGWEWYWTQDGLGNIRNRVLRSEMVFVDNVALGSRLAASELVPGTFYVDESGGVITVMLPANMTAPISSYQVDVAVRQPVLTINGRRNVTIKGLQIEKGRGALQEVMASAINSVNIVLDGVIIRFAAATAWGSTYNQGLTIRNSQFVDNGVTGLSAQRDKGSLLETSIIARNNWRGWANEVKGYDAVFKWGGMRDAVVRQTQFTDNWGSGFWLDYDNQRVTADQIFSARNQSAGVTMEMNPGPITISNSKFCNNDTGVEDARTNYLTLTNNKLFNNKNAELLFTGSGTPVNVPDWETGVVRTTASLYHVYTGNTIYGTGPTVAGIAQWLLWGPFGTIYTTYFRPTVRSDYNTWYHADRTNGMALDNLSGGINFWTYQLNDLRSANHWNHSSNPNSPNNESHSTWSNPGVLSCSWP